MSDRPLSTQSKRKIALVVIPGDKGQKFNHLALITHRGGGWYEVECMGEGKRCKAGECKHTANMHWDGTKRRIRQVPR
jgi:hypothetical protein